MDILFLVSGISPLSSQILNWTTSESGGGAATVSSHQGKRAQPRPLGWVCRESESPGAEIQRLPLALQVNSINIFRLVLSFLLRTTGCLCQPGYKEGEVGDWGGS